MDLLTWLRVAVLVIGAGTAVYGVVVLVTGRVSDRNRAAFRSIRDAGRYSLFSGLALVFLALGQFAGDSPSFSLPLTIAALLIAVTLGVLAFRHRPRRPNPQA